MNNERIQSLIDTIKSVSGGMTTDNFEEKMNLIDDIRVEIEHLGGYVWHGWEYVLDTYNNGNRTHAKEHFNQLPCNLKCLVAHKLGSHGFGYIYDFISK